MRPLEERPALQWSAIRAGYPALSGRAYLDTACKGIPGPAAEDAVLRHVRRLRESPANSATDETIVMLDEFERARAATAALIGATPDEIALVPSTEAGIAAMATSLSIEPGSNVVASELEFFGTVLPWRFRESVDIELKLLPHRQGRIDLADIDAAIDARTCAVVISSVQEVNGFRIDLDELSKLCRSRSVLLFVDAIQHVGPLPLDVGATPIDAIAVGGHKWLCAPFGMGFLYVSRRIFDRLRPPAHAFMTAYPPDGGWSRYLESPERHPADELSFPGDARQLETGALGTTLAAAGLAASAETLRTIGLDEIADRSADLVRQTTAALEGAGAVIVTPRTPQPSSIVTFRTSDDIDQERALVAKLAAESVLTSLRFTTGVGGIRVSPYFYNDENDIDKLASIVERHVRAVG